MFSARSSERSDKSSWSVEVWILDDTGSPLGYYSNYSSFAAHTHYFHHDR